MPMLSFIAQQVNICKERFNNIVTDVSDYCKRVIFISRRLHVLQS